MMTKTKKNRKTTLSISGRHMYGYPTISFDLKFKDMEDLIAQIDNHIDQCDFGKVDVYVTDNGQFSDEELQILDNESIFTN